MLNETHIKFTSPTFMVSHPNPAVLKPWHGTSDIFTQSSVNYNSFSLEKAQRQTIKNRILQTQGISKRKDLVTQIKIRKAVQTTIKNEDEWGAILKEKIKGHKEHDELYQKSATLIQKYARRFLTKLKYEPLLISKRKRDVSVDIDLMKTQADGCLFHLGKITNEVKSI